jgi:hypothetical protein
MLSALAVELRELPDEQIKSIHKLINDDRDGYTFDFISEVNSMRSFVVSNHSIGVK